MAEGPNQRRNAPSLAFDVGGTFTDIVVLGADGSIETSKVLSGSALLDASLEDAVARHDPADGRPSQLAVLHATTVASNALLERSGPRIGLLTTAGFRDELEIRRGARPSVYDFDWERPAPLIPRRLRCEVVERVTASGEVRVPLDEQSVLDALQLLVAEGIEALAICFLNSYANPVHERRARELAQEAMPGVAVSLSYDVLPQPREYERTSTTSVNAYLMPVVSSYLGRLSHQLGRAGSSLRVMRSNGGLMTAAEATRLPVYMVESGPAAGVLAAASLCREVGVDRAVAFDMGGTTVKASLIEQATPEERTDYEVGGESHSSARYSQGGGFAVSVSSLDIVEAGAGGGSIARVVDGVLRVGPVSAGADPGPAAYGHGGTEPTVTDANIVLGMINPTTIAGGTLGVDRDAAIRAIRDRLQPDLGLDVLDIAHGIRQVANASMLRSIRAVTSERGRDPRQYTMIAYGGSGPVHAASLAEMAGIQTVYVPPLPGLFSAVGLLLADRRSDHVHAAQGPLQAEGMDDRIVDAFGGLLDAARAEATQAGTPAEALSFAYLADVRYAGQSYDTTVPLGEDLHPTGLAQAIDELFQQEHQRRFGYRIDNEPVVLTALRLRAWATARAASLDDVGRASLNGSQPAGETARDIYLGPEAGLVRAQIIDRHRLRASGYDGPVIVEEESTTVVVPPGWRAHLDDHFTIVLQRG